AFGKPYAAQSTTEMLLIAGDGDLYLRTSYCFGRDERQETMRRAAGDQLGDTCVLQAAKAAYEIVPIDFVPESFGRAQGFVVHARRVMKLRQRAEGAIKLFFGERDQVVEVARVACLQKRIGQHLAECGRDVDRQARAHALFIQARERCDERQIDLCDRLVEPILFEKFGMLRVAHERQVRVEDETEEALTHRKDQTTKTQRIQRESALIFVSFVSLWLTVAH